VIYRYTPQIYSLSLHDALPISKPHNEVMTYGTRNTAGTVRNMLEDFAAWAFTNPLGITITGTVLAVAIVAIAARASKGFRTVVRSEEHTSELQSRENLVCRLLL